MNPLTLARGLTSALAAALALTLAPPARAGDVYARVPIADLQLTSGELPTAPPNPWTWADPRLASAISTYVVLGGDGEAYVDHGQEDPARGAWSFPDVREATLVLRLSEPRGVTGRLFVPDVDGAERTPAPHGLRRLEFTVAAEAFGEEPRDAFLAGKARHYEALLQRGLPGAAWFRHQARVAREALGEAARPSEGPRPLGLARGDLDETYELFHGGRAVSENLQLDRALPFALGGESTVSLDSIPGVATTAYDWTPEIEGKQPELDPLARLVPQDQHAVFFPSFAALLAVVEEMELDGTPLLELFEARSEDARMRSRYERQLCLPLDQRTRALGPLVIGSLALTGSDPYLRTGSDVAVLMTSRTPAALVAFVRSEQQAALDTVEGARLERGALAGCEYQALLSPGRALCSYVADLGDGAVAVTNSLQQLERVLATGSGELDSVAQAPETVFFRDRYPRAETGEEALLVLTDAAIRRWCGPRWRIGASRRTQAAAWMADAQAAWLAHRAGLTDEPPPRELPDGSALAWGEDGLRSERWGTLTFLTPVAELDLVKVTPGEKQAYERFRNRYQSGWRNWFDPIAVRLSRRAGVVEADVTVRPLIAGSDYRQWMELVGDARLGPLASDPHEGTLLHFAMAIDTDAEPFRFAAGLLSGGRPDPLDSAFAWIGDGLGLYVEPDPFFEEWRAAEARDEGDVYFEDHLGELPLVLQVESRDPLKLAAFLISFRAFAEGAAPGLTEWSTRQHGDRTYVRVGAAPESRDNLGQAGEIALWYASLPDALIVTLREDLLLRALERHDARVSEGAPEARRWQGGSLALRVDGRMLELARELAGEREQRRHQALAWSALPILREWRLRFPDEDALDVHERLSGVRLVDPAGGDYAWDEAWSTFASTRYGHPGEPLEGPIWPPALERVSEVDLGLTFEQDGLRARVLLRRE